MASANLVLATMKAISGLRLGWRPSSRQSAKPVASTHDVVATWPGSFFPRLPGFLLRAGGGHRAIAPVRAAARGLVAS